MPHLAARAVDRGWRVAARDGTPSYRQARVDALARTGTPIVVRLRESNVLTSTIYRPSRDDSTFLFFTDDALLLRPLLGAANLVVGTGATLLGFLQAPVDRGAALGAGLRGVLWSLPELFFVNVRKGSFGHVARGDALPTGSSRWTRLGDDVHPRTNHVGATETEAFRRSTGHDRPRGSRRPNASSVPPARG